MSAHYHIDPQTDTLTQMVDAVHGLAWSKGWHNPDESEDAFIERSCNNLHDEVSELHEAWRNNNLRGLCDKAARMGQAGIIPLTCLEEEFADIVIRVMDNAKRLDVDLASAISRKHEFNATRPHRHGGKRS
jgi:NTP pyrophosphatase (non-canonical NTP hydrolase)